MNPALADDIARALKKARRLRRDMNRTYNVADSVLPQANPGMIDNAQAVAKHTDLDGNDDEPTPEPAMKEVVIKHLLDRPTLLTKTSDLGDFVGDYARHSALNAGQAARDLRYISSHPDAESLPESMAKRIKSFGINAFYTALPPQLHHSKKELAELREKTPSEWFHQGYKPWEKRADLQDSVKLQPHQKRVMEKLKTQDALLLYHGLGSGKTLSSLAATEGMDRDVIVPASLRNNYWNEVNSKTDRDTPTNVMSYERSIKPFKQSSTLVVDEAHRLGNVSTQRSQRLLEKIKQYKKRVLLTGTPIRNHPSELAPLLHVLDPKTRVPLDPAQFNKRYVHEVDVNPGLIDKYVFGVEPGVEQRPQNLGELRRAFAGKVDYYQPEHENFPDRHDQVTKVEMSPEQADIYRTITEKANPKIAKKIRENFPLSKRESEDLNAFMTAARIVSNTTRPYGGKEYSPKMTRALSDFKNAMAQNPGHKAVTYSAYTEGGVDEYARLLKEHNIPHGVFKGGLSDKERKRLVDEYNSGKLRNLLITGAGAEGLDLKGTRAIQLLESHWNNPRLEQAVGRGIRFGSHTHLPEDERNVEVLKYQSTLPRSWWQKVWGEDADTAADEYLGALADKKQQLNQAFLDVLKDASNRRPS